jgi:hypothetical protein
VTEEFPLRVAWRFEVPWSCWVDHAPLVRAGEVVALCGPAVVGLDAATGRKRWQVDLPDGGDGEFFTRFGDLFVTSTFHRAERVTSILGVTREGVLWRTELPIVLGRGNAIPAGDELWVFGRGTVERPRLRCLDPTTGVVRRTIDAPFGASSFLPMGDAVLYAARDPGPAEHALCRVRGAGDPEPFLTSARGVWTMRREGEVVVTVARGASTEPRLVEARDAATLQILWTAQAASDTAKLGGGEVAFVSGVELAPTLRGARGGDELWRGEPLPAPAGRVILAGPLAVFIHAGGAAFYRRQSGALLGHAEAQLGADATYHDGRLLIGDSDAVICAIVEP